MTSWKNRLRRMLLLDMLEPLVGHTPKVAELCSNSANLSAAAVNMAMPSDMDHGRCWRLRSRLTKKLTAPQIRPASPTTVAPYIMNNTGSYSASGIAAPLDHRR